MDINEFKKYTKELSLYSGSEIDNFEFMTEEELGEYQNELEVFDGGNLSTWEHIRALFTLKKKIADLSK
jgi:hypothetical protein